MFRTLIVLFGFLPILAAADTFFVTEAQQGSIGSGSVERLVRSELTSTGHTVLESAERAQWVISTDAIKLGNSYIVKDGKVVYADKLKSTALDDLDTVVTRLVSGALNNITADNSMTVDTVTRDEATGTTRKTKVTRQTYLGFGPSKSANLDTNNAGRSFSVGALWGIDDLVSIRTGFSTNSVSDSTAGMNSLSIGGHYYLNKRKHAQYAVGLVGYTWAESDTLSEDGSFFSEGVSESGWGIEAGVGTHFYRTATVNIAAELTYNQALFTVTDGAPGTLGAKLVVFW